ncbi:MAG: hypothetical protein P8Y48_11915 [Novosphingobium sp.]
MTGDSPSLAQVTRGITALDVAQRTAALAMSALFIAGSLDGISPPALGEAMAAKAPHISPTPIGLRTSPRLMLGFLRADG